ncbi:unnamed protein product [Brachionus calyciflorus]|uniref:Uncharacterized protein n=1 Tax=Brachionus calyciflorus TaxID=104777 RepID=A0A813MZW6_9BILA|nr:unnamed protein product [Brachionus calyciflorus]
MTIEDEQQSNLIQVEDNFRLKNWKNFETINTIVAELRNTEKAYESFDLNVKINLELEDIVVVLRNILGLKDPVAHVVIDESQNGGIFSSNLLEQAKSGEKCCQKIAGILESCDKKLSNLPILIVTGSNSSVKIVVLFPCSLQNPRLSDSTLVYMIDPLSGNLDICKQTQKNLFFKYLQRGSAAIGLKALFKNLISNKKDNVSKCKKSADSAYLCLIYCLFLFEYGNDEFITAEWSNILKNLDIKKTALLNRIESYVAKRGLALQNQPTKSLQLSQLNEIDSQIDQVLRDNLSKLEKEKIKLEQNSEQAQLDEMVRLEKTLVEKHNKLNIEIKSLEKFINEHLNSESVEPIGKSLTMEKKYKQFISGEERRRIETDEQKKLLSVRSNLMHKSEKESRKVFHDQIETIMVLVRAKEQEASRIKENILCLENNSKELSLQIAEKQEKLDTSKTQLVNRANDKSLFLNKMKESVQLAQCFNKLEIDSCPSKWIEDVLKLNVYSDQDKLSDLGKRLDQITKIMQQTNQDLEECKNQTNDLLVKRDENKVELDEFENEISELKEKICAKNSELREKQTEKDSYDTLLWRLLYSSTFDSLSKQVEELQNCITKLENELADLNSKIDSKKSENIDLKDKIEKLGQKKIVLSQALSNLSNRDIVTELKNIKNQIVQQFSDEQKDIQIEIDNVAISMIKIEKDISLYTSQIEIDADQMAKLSMDKKELLEIIELVNLKKKQLEDQIIKIKQNLDNNVISLLGDLMSFI